MSSERKPNLLLKFGPRIGLWVVTVMVAVVVAWGAIMIVFAGPAPSAPAWEDILTTFVGAWLIGCIPISLMRWVAAPEARIDGALGSGLLTMAVGGASLVLPVLSQGRIDSSIAFVLVLGLFAVQAIISLIMHWKADEMMRQYNAESSAIGATVLVGAFSIYAAGEYLGVIGPVSPWGLVGIACLIQSAVSMYVYYRLGMNPEAQEKAATDAL
jgi:hypothetical protein